MAFRDFKALARRKGADKVLLDIAFNIAKRVKNDRCHCGFASIIFNYRGFIKLVIKKLQVVKFK